MPEELALIKTRKSIRLRTYEDKDGIVTVWPEGGFQLFPPAGKVYRANIIYVNDAGLNPAGLCGKLVIEWVEESKVKIHNPQLLGECNCCNDGYFEHAINEDFRRAAEINHPFQAEPGEEPVTKFTDPTPDPAPHVSYQNSCPCPECQSHPADDTPTLEELDINGELTQLDIFPEEEVHKLSEDCDCDNCMSHYLSKDGWLW